MSMSGTRQTIFKTTGVNNETAGFVLGEGESQNKIKVVAIDEQSGMVTFDNHGTIQKILIKEASPLNAYVPPSPSPVSAAVPPVSIPAASERKIPGPSGSASVMVIGSQRNDRLTGFRHINGIMPQSIDENPNNSVPGSSPVPKNISSANQPVQSASAPPPPSTPLPPPPSQPGGPQVISVGAGMESAGAQRMSVPTPAPNGSSR